MDDKELLSRKDKAKERNVKFSKEARFKEPEMDDKKLLSRRDKAKQNNTKFSKASRFKEPEMDTKELLHPSINFARPTY